MQFIHLFIIPVVLSLSHYLGHIFEVRKRTAIEYFQSIAAGFAIGYVFLILLPEIYTIELENGVNATMLTMMGFVLFHVSLKYIYQTTHTRKTALLVDEVHLITVGTYNFLISFSLAELGKVSFQETIVLLALISFHATLSEMSHSHPHINKINMLRLPIIFTATFVGGILGIFEIFNSNYTEIFFAITAGSVIYIAIREEIPQDSRGKPIFFVLGCILFFLVTSYFGKI